MSQKNNHIGSRYHLKSSVKSPTLEIDLKKISPDSNQKNKSKYHSSIDLTDFIESVPSILRPMKIEEVTPPISKNWRNSNFEEDYPLIPSYESISRQNYIQKREYNKIIAKLDRLLEEEDYEEDIKDDDEDIIYEEEDVQELSSLSDFTDEMDEKPLKHLDSLISKIKVTSKEIKNKPEKSFSKGKFHEYSSENSLEIQCHRLNKYLEDNDIFIESEDDYRNKNMTCDMKNHTRYTSNIYQSQNNQRYVTSKISISDRQINADFNSSSIQELSSPIKRKKIISSSQGVLKQKCKRNEQSQMRNASILYQLEEL
ncbi:hypothetical protein M9Y10_042025 [Tritrichomonas musculus]|uniref:Uncharacterized protein n=1 Tax=Tritrichomonas musculus TaxID=1915356 RepID=A0ABR2K6N5_9EUKA